MIQLRLCGLESHTLNRLKNSDISLDSPMSVSESTTTESAVAHDMEGHYEAFESRFPGVMKSTTAGLLCSEVHRDGRAQLRTLLTGCQLKSSDLNPLITSSPGIFHEISEADLLALLEQDTNGGKTWEEVGIDDDLAQQFFTGIERDESETDLVASIISTTRSLSEKAGFLRSKSVCNRNLIGGGVLNYRPKASDPLPDIPACASTRADLLFLSTNPQKPIGAAVECKGKPVSELDEYGVEVLLTDDALGEQTMLNLAAADTNFVLSVRKTAFSVIARMPDQSSHQRRFILFKIPDGNTMLSFDEPRHQIFFIKICYAIGRISGIPFQSSDSSQTTNAVRSSYPLAYDDQLLKSVWISPEGVEIDVISIPLPLLSPEEFADINELHDELLKQRIEEYD